LLVLILLTRRRLTSDDPGTAEVGTITPAEHDDNFVFPVGMTLVLEPVVWEGGTRGYRSEEIVVITDEGCIRLTEYPYSPYRTR
jgi:Xaa-Pro dipeptidase